MRIAACDDDVNFLQELTALLNVYGKENGETITKEYLLKFKYDEYMIDKTVFDAGTEDEVFAKPSAGGILKQ